MKQLKEEFKKNNLWKKYKKKFKHKQMKFITSKLILVLNKNVNFNDLFLIEKTIFLHEKNEKMFLDALNNFQNQINFNFDIYVLGKLLWIIFQTSTYWKDKGKKIANIFNENNYVVVNEQKRKLFYQFVDSIILFDKHNFNKIVQKIIGFIF